MLALNTFGPLELILQFGLENLHYDTLVVVWVIKSTLGYFGSSDI